MGRIIAVALGDAVVFVIFSLVGRGNHHEASGAGALPDVLGTAAPFLVGWFLVAPLVGAYRHSALGPVRSALPRTALAWAVAGPVGLLLRAALLRRGIPLSFAIVALLFNLGALLAWRGIAAAMPWRGEARSG